MKIVKTKLGDVLFDDDVYDDLDLDNKAVLMARGGYPYIYLSRRSGTQRVAYLARYIMGLPGRRICRLKVYYLDGNPRNLQRSNLSVEPPREGIMERLGRIEERHRQRNEKRSINREKVLEQQRNRDKIRAAKKKRLSYLRSAIACREKE